MKVAEFELLAAKDQAEAISARGKAAAEVIAFENEAEAAGWKKTVEAYDGSGDEFARWVMLKKRAPSYRQMMINTADSPLMEIFEEYNANSAKEIGSERNLDSESDRRALPVATINRTGNNKATKKTEETTGANE